MGTSTIAGATTLPGQHMHKTLQISISKEIQNLASVFARADAEDRSTGLHIYCKYRDLMCEFSDRYHYPLERVVAAFVSLSPNNDYVGNLRSLLSLCEGIESHYSLERIKVSTYRACLQRAYNYLIGEKEFLQETCGYKIINFYHNVLRPHDNRFVTIDGHVSAIWRGGLIPMTMKDAVIRSGSEYDQIACAVKQLAFSEFLLPNQYQAILWLTRKRLLGIKYDPQLSLFADVCRDKEWGQHLTLADLEPFA